jgi:hypothetical protein
VRRVVRYMALFLAAPFGLAPAQSTAKTPEQVVREFFKAEDDGRWMDAAHSVDLTQFEPIRRAAVQGARSMASRPKTTVQDVRRWQPDLPLAVAEYEAKRANEIVPSVNFLSHEFARVSSADSLAALPIDEAAARWLEAKGAKWQDEVADKEASRRPEADCPKVPDSIARSIHTSVTRPVTTILGATEASDSVRYVVVGSPRFGGHDGKPLEAPYPRESPRAITLRTVDGEWRIVPASDLPTSDSMGGGFIVSIKCRKEPPPKSGTPQK